MSNYLDDYQRWTRSTAIYPANEAINYLTLGLASEAGEVAGKVKKKLRDGTFDRADFISELSDCLWYITRLADELGIDLLMGFDSNFQKLESRKQRDKLKGSGDHR